MAEKNSNQCNKSRRNGSSKHKEGLADTGLRDKTSKKNFDTQKNSSAQSTDKFHEETGSKCYKSPKKKISTDKKSNPKATRPQKYRKSRKINKVMSRKLSFELKKCERVKNKNCFSKIDSSSQKKHSIVAKIGKNSEIKKDSNKRTKISIPKIIIELVPKSRSKRRKRPSISKAIIDLAPKVGTNRQMKSAKSKVIIDSVSKAHSNRGKEFSVSTIIKKNTRPETSSQLDSMATKNSNVRKTSIPPKEITDSMARAAYIICNKSLHYRKVMDAPTKLDAIRHEKHRDKITNEVLRNTFAIPKKYIIQNVNTISKKGRNRHKYSTLKIISDLFSKLGFVRNNKLSTLGLKIMEIMYGTLGTYKNKSPAFKIITSKKSKKYSRRHISLSAPKLSRKNHKPAFYKENDSHVVQSLKCFNCNSNQMPCLEPFNKTLASKYYSVYPEVTDGMVCVKHVTKLPNGLKYVERKYMMFEHARQYCNNEEKQKLFCSWCRNEDGCNSAPSPRQTLNQFIVLIVLCVVAMCFSKF